MKKPASVQYTIRNIPEHVDRVLRQRAAETHKSFNQVVIEALTAGSGETSAPKRDLTGIVGIWTAAEADEFEEHVRMQRRVDPEMWS